MNILVFAPHADDELLGVGGTIAKRIADNHKVYVCIVTRGQLPIFSPQERVQCTKEIEKAHHYMGTEEVVTLDYPAAMLESVVRHELNDTLIKIVERIQPDEVYLPHWGDMQLDHRLVVKAAMVALRPKYSFTPKRIYAYETLSETGWNIPNTTNDFVPTVYEDISDFLQKKLEALACYESQLAPFPAARSLEAVEALAKFRGATVNVRAAEAFTLIREIR